MKKPTNTKILGHHNKQSDITAAGRLVRFNNIEHANLIKRTLSGGNIGRKVLEKEFNKAREQPSSKEVIDSDQTFNITNFQNVSR